MNLINKFPQIVITGLSLYILWLMAYSTNLIQVVVDLIR